MQAVPSTVQSRRQLHEEWRFSVSAHLLCHSESVGFILSSGYTNGLQAPRSFYYQDVLGLHLEVLEKSRSRKSTDQAARYVEETTSLPETRRRLPGIASLFLELLVQSSTPGRGNDGRQVRFRSQALQLLERPSRTCAVKLNSSGSRFASFTQPVPISISREHVISFSYPLCCTPHRLRSALNQSQLALQEYRFGGLANLLLSRLPSNELQRAYES